VEVEVGHAISATAIDFTPKFASYTTEVQRDALAGTSGTPSSTNKFVTNDDTADDGTASKIVRLDSSSNIAEHSKSKQTLKAGETISGATLPVAVYQSTADNEIYACDGNDAAKYQYLGFAISDGTDGNDIDVQMTGIVPGFTGLAEGTKYYVQNDSTIGTTPSTTQRIYVGRATSETQLLIEKEEDLFTVLAITRSNVADGTVDTAHGLGVVPKWVKITAYCDATDTSSGSVGTYITSTNTTKTIYYLETGSTTATAEIDTTNIVNIFQVSNKTTAATIAVDATNISLSWTKGVGNPPETQLLIEVQA